MRKNYTYEASSPTIPAPSINFSLLAANQMKIKQDMNESLRVRLCFTTKKSTNETTNLEIQLSTTSKPDLLTLEIEKYPSEVNFAVDLYGKELYQLEYDLDQGYNNSNYINMVMHALAKAGIYKRPDNGVHEVTRGSYILSIPCEDKLPTNIPELINLLKSIKSKQYAKTPACEFPDNAKTPSGQELYIPTQADIAAAQKQIDAHEAKIDAESRKVTCLIM